MTAARRHLSRILITAGLGFLVAAQTVHARQQPFVPNVEAQFNALSVRPDPLGFDIANSPDPTTCKHYEGIARLQGADGTPYFALTRSGLYTFPCVLTDDEPGSLTIVRMGSRGKNGERLRSNRLKKGSDLADTFSDPDCVAPNYPNCLQDLAVTHRRFNGAGGWPIYGHPESMQTIGNILVVGVDTPLEADGDRDANAPPMRVLFMNAADPEHLEIINEFVPANAPVNNRDINGGIVAITPLATGRYLMMINVAPAITAFGIFNGLNQQLGTTVPFFIAGLPVTVRGSFTDAGKPDHQSAVINWGDGISSASAEFTSFADAFGGAKGQLEHTRTYAGGGTFNLTLTVTDDDLAPTARSIAVPVLTTEQALVRMIQMLDEIIAGTTDPAVKKVLLDARKALQWNGESGALDKVRLKDPQGALVKLGQTRDSLRAAQSAGANVGTLIALVEQAMASLL